MNQPEFQFVQSQTILVPVGNFLFQSTILKLKTEFHEVWCQSNFEHYQVANGRTDLPWT